MVTASEDRSGEVSATVADWTRESDPGMPQAARKLLRALRDHERHAATGGPIAGLLRRLASLRHRRCSTATGADIPLGTRIGGGLIMPHPNGIVIHGSAQVGVNCLVFQQVTIGTAGGAAPRIGGHVDIGAGAKILGDITVGDHARIGANAVVLQDVPAGATAVGVPARIIGGA